MSQNSAKTKRKPYTHLACFYCKEKHLKCDGRKPSCSTCAAKRVECQYREERNRKRETTPIKAQMEDDLRQHVVLLQQEVDKWKQKYMRLKVLVKNHSLPINDCNSDEDNAPRPFTISSMPRRSFSLPDSPAMLNETRESWTQNNTTAISSGFVNPLQFIDMTKVTNEYVNNTGTSPYPYSHSMPARRVESSEELPHFGSSFPKRSQLMRNFVIKQPVDQQNFFDERKRSWSSSDIPHTLSQSFPPPSQKRRAQSNSAGIVFENGPQPHDMKMDSDMFDAEIDHNETNAHFSDAMFIPHYSMNDGMGGF